MLNLLYHLFQPLQDYNFINKKKKKIKKIITNLFDNHLI